jgi:hypothetical protein
MLRLRAEEKKRKERRKEPLDAIELQAALRKAEELVHWMRAEIN